MFRLWAKAEMSDDEKDLIGRYSLQGACVLEGNDEGPWKGALLVGTIVFTLVGLGLMHWSANIYLAVGGGVGGGAIAALTWRNEKRETIFLSDLMFGRRFKCRSIVDLVKKEAMLEDVTIAVRQVLEASKNWDGVETRPIPVLLPDAAKDIVARLN